MGGNLRVGSGADRLQRTLAMRALRVASASVLSLVALLLCIATEPSTSRALHRGEPTAIANALTRDIGSTVAAARPVTSRKAALSHRVAGRHQLLVRARAGEGDGDPTPTTALAHSPAHLIDDVADSARDRLRQLALGHAPYGEPSPFDATAPPAPGPRNG